MQRIFKSQTALRIKLCTNVSLSSVTSARIKYIKPTGATGEWVAELDNATQSVYYDVLSATDINVTGIWKMWSYLTYSNGNSAAGKVVQILVIDQGEV